jgi:hypothetical protein
MNKTALAVLKRIIEENPDATERQWREMFVAEVMADEDLKKAVATDVFKDFLRQRRVH